jgi:ABC-type phosphate transport system substrate-binding protein
MPDMIAQVSSNKGAIGWEVLGMVEHYRNIGKVKPLRINGYSPTDVDAIAAKKYPFYRTYNITTWEGKAWRTLGPGACRLPDEGGGQPWSRARVCPGNEAPQGRMEV